VRTIPREVQDFARIKDSFKLSEKQKNVLLGTLLGDGSLKRRGNFYRLHIKHSYKQISLVRYKREVFSNITNMPTRVFFQRVKDKDYKFCEFVTLTHPEFSEYRKLFYKDKKKVISQKLKQLLKSPLSLAMWFMDDGCAEYAGVSFNTQCFSLKEVGFLSYILKENFGLDSTIRKNKNGWIIYIPKNNLNKFTNTIKKYLLPDFLYKLEPYSTRS
jgi:DNA-binding transcriptional regulator WhiA